MGLGASWARRGSWGGGAGRKSLGSQWDWGRGRLAELKEGFWTPVSHFLSPGALMSGGWMQRLAQLGRSLWVW